MESPHAVTKKTAPSAAPRIDLFRVTCGVVRDSCEVAHFLGGRRTSSPPQLGHTLFIDVAHASQNVHSYVQMNAAPVAGVPA